MLCGVRRFITAFMTFQKPKQTTSQSLAKVRSFYCIMSCRRQQSMCFFNVGRPGFLFTQRRISEKLRWVCCRYVAVLAGVCVVDISYFGVLMQFGPFSRLSHQPAAMWKFAVVVHWLLPSAALSWWCETSAVTGCRGRPRQFVLDGSGDAADPFEASRVSDVVRPVGVMLAHIYNMQYVNENVYLLLCREPRHQAKHQTTPTISITVR